MDVRYKKVSGAETRGERALLLHASPIASERRSSRLLLFTARRGTFFAVDSKVPRHLT